MDLLIFAGTLLVTGYYVRNKNQNPIGKRKREVDHQITTTQAPVRENMLPVNDVYRQPNENVYNSNKMEANRADEQEKADKMFTRTNMYAPLNTFKEFPFDEKPNVSSVKGLRTDNLSSTTFERFSGTDYSLKAKQEKINDQVLQKQIPYEYADNLPRERWEYEIGKTKDGVSFQKQFPEQPIIEGNFYAKPKPSEELFANPRTNELKNNREIAGGRAVIGQQVIAPVDVRPKRNYRIVDGLGDSTQYSIPASATVSGGMYRNVEGSRSSKSELEMDSKLLGGVSTNIRLTPQSGDPTVIENFSQIEPKRKFVQDVGDSYFVPGNSRHIAGDRHRQYQDSLPYTERSMNIEADRYIGNAAQPGLGTVFPKNKDDFRTTLKETLLHSRVAGPPEAPNKEARDMTNYQLETTNKELNIESKHVGLAERSGVGELNRDIGELRTTMKETNVFNNEGRNIGNTQYGQFVTKDFASSDRKSDKMGIPETAKSVNVGGIETNNRNTELFETEGRRNSKINFDESVFRNIASVDTNTKFHDSKNVSTDKIKSKDFVFASKNE